MAKSTFFIVLFAVVAAVAIGVGLWAYFRWRYVKSLRDKGWTFVTDPSCSITEGLNFPPFGLGIRRRVDDQVYGVVDGMEFNVFEYKTDRFAENRVTAIRLPWALPEFAVAPAVDRSVTLRMPDPQWRQAAERAVAQVGPGLLEAQPEGFQLTIDGNHLVLLNTPKETAEMEAHIRLAVQAARAFSTPDMERFAQPLPEQRMGFYGTDWTYEPRNDEALAYVQHTTDGFDHSANDVISGPNAGLAFLAMRHHWKTESEDSDGRKHTHHHDEYLLEVNLPFPFSPISFNAGWFSGGQTRHFESITFDDTFVVRSQSDKFAHDVLHPRTMQWMEQQGRVELSIEDHRARWKINALEPGLIAWCLLWCHGFFGRVPSFVWDDLGLPDAQHPTFLDIPDGPLPV